MDVKKEELLREPQSAPKGRQTAETLTEAPKWESENLRTEVMGEKAAALLLQETTENTEQPDAPTSGQQQMPAGSLYDLSGLQSLSRGNPKFTERIKQLFVQTVPETVADMQQKHAAADWSGVSAAAHKLKSTIDMMRIGTLKEVVRRIESNAKNQTDLQAVSKDLALLQAVLEEIIRQLQDEASGGGVP